MSDSGIDGRPRNGDDDGAGRTLRAENKNTSRLSSKPLNPHPSSSSVYLRLRANAPCRRMSTGCRPGVEGPSRPYWCRRAKVVPTQPKRLTGGRSGGVASTASGPLWLGRTKLACQAVFVISFPHSRRVGRKPVVQCCTQDSHRPAGTRRSGEVDGPVLRIRV